MARMPSKRFEEIVEKVSFRLVMGGPDLVSADMASTLLSRQHAAFVRRVNEKRKITVSMCRTSEFCKGYCEACADILKLLWK